MDDNEHFEFVEFMQGQDKLKDYNFEFVEFMQEQELIIKTTEANLELEEEINPIT